MALKIVGAGASRTFRNLWMLEELSLPYERILADPRSTEASATNPMGKIPSLIHGDFVMYESVAINTYLGDVFRGKTGLPDLVPVAGTIERGLYEQKIATLLSEIDAQALWIHRKHKAMAHVFGNAPEAVTHAENQFHRVFDVLVADLYISGDYFLGTTFSAVDIMFVHCINWAEMIGWGGKWTSGETTDEKIIHLCDYLTRCRSRPAYIRSMEIRQAEQSSSK